MGNTAAKIHQRGCLLLTTQCSLGTNVRHWRVFAFRVHLSGIGFLVDPAVFISFHKVRDFHMITTLIAAWPMLCDLLKPSCVHA